MTDVDQPEDEQRDDEAAAEAPAEQIPTETPEEGAEQPAPTPEPSAPAAEEPAPTAQVPAAEAAAVDVPVVEVPGAEPPAPEAAPTPGPEEADREEMEVGPRQHPEIPGADLVPDLVSDSDDFLDAEARAAAEADAEAAARLTDDASEDVSQPIADAAIDLAAGARYTSTGKRKTAVARVILKPGAGTYSINGKDLDDFFPRDTLRRVIRQPLEAVGYQSRMDVVARMHGGGVSAQAGALRHGISRALIVADPNLRGELKRRGFLTRDPRVKERKKAGLKKARKRPQFSKR